MPASIRSPVRQLLEQPRQPPILQHPPARLLLGAVTHDVVLEVDRLDRGAAARARLALAAVDLERHRQLVGDRRADHLLVVVERAAEPLADRDAQPLDLVGVEVVALLERRQLARSRGSRRPTSGRSRRSCAGRAAAGGGGAAGRSARRRSSGRGRPAPRARASPPLVLVDRVGRQQLRPRPLLGPELAQAQLALAVVEPHQQPRGLVAQRRRARPRAAAGRPTSGGSAAPDRRSSTSNSFPRRRDPVKRRGRRARRAAGRTSSSSPCPAPAPTRRVAPRRGGRQPARGDLDLG